MTERDDTSGYEVRVLGPLAVVGPDGPVDPGGPKPRLLLALLVAEAGRVVSTERLIDGLWGDDPPDTARKTVQVHVSNLRRSLGPSFPLDTARGGYRVDASHITVDAVRFESDLARASELRTDRPDEAGAVLTAALGRWHGSPYADLADEEAIRAEVTRLTELRLSALEQRIDADLQLGRHDRVLGELEVLTADHPYRERFRMQQMLALYRSGRQTDALRAYERTRHVLADELGIDPTPALRELHQQILLQSPELDAPAPSVAEGMPAQSGATSTGASGEHVRGYELRERLGARADATVYRAYQPSVGREVALKVIPPELANRPDFVKRFDAECRLLAELEHPHVVTMLDYWRDPDGAYLAMPLFGGGTLAQSLERDRWRPPATLRTLDQIGAALAYAHRRGVVHGDLRAANVLLDDDGNAYLTDFRLDLAAGDLAAPDRPVTPADDVRELAALTCEMLTGIRPEHGEPVPSFAYTPFDLPPAFDDVIARALDPDPERRFGGVDAYLRAVRRAFGADVVTAEAPSVDRHIRNPYKGLRAFGETDAGDYHGRDDLVQELLDHVAAHPLTVVVGPSGSGKSSLVRAGLVPAARHGRLGARDLVVAEMFPGSYPFEELAAALLRVAVDRPPDIVSDLGADERGLMRVSKQILPDDDTDLLLIVDQFEELFALTDDESVRRSFLGNLVTVAADERSRVRVVLTLRADFFDRPLHHPAFGELMKSSLMTVALPSDERLAEAIARPAHGVGLEIEPGLIPTILRDVASEPGALPMLQYALTELVETREGDVLTLAGYRRTGGVIGALAARAEEIYAGLSGPARETAREVFLRLVSVHDESDDTRRRVRRTELEGLDLPPQHLAAVLDGFGSFRLLSFDRDPVTRGPTVEVAHEALIREWPRFREWVDARRDDLHTERRLQSVVGEWLQSDRDPTLLISAGRLARYEQWAAAPHVRLSADERAFLDASRNVERSRAASTAKRRRLVLAGVSTLAVVALVLALVAVVQRNRADDEARQAAAESERANEAAATAERLRIETERSATVDVARSLAGQATTIRDSDTPLLLALEAYDSLVAVGAESAAVTSALYQTAYDQRIAARFPVSADIGLSFLSSSPDGSRLLLPTGLDEVSILDLGTGERLVTIDVPDGVFGGTWDQDDDVVLVGTTTGAIEVFEGDGTLVRTEQVADAFVFPFGVRDGHVDYAVATADGATFGSTVLGAGTSAHASGGPGWKGQASIDGLGPSDSGRYVVWVDATGVAHTTRTDTWTEVASFDVAEEDQLRFMWWVPGEDQIWLLHGSVISRVDVTTGESLADFDAGRDDLLYVLPSPDGTLLATMGSNGQEQLVLDATSGAVVAQLDEPIPLDGAIWSATGRRLVLRHGGEIVVWSLELPNAPTTLWPGTTFAPLVTAPLANGDVLFGSSDGAVQIRTPTGTTLRRSFPASGPPDTPPLVSADGSSVLVPGEDAVEVYDVGADRVRATGPAGYPRPLAVSADGRSIVVGTATDTGESGSIAIVDGVSGELVHSIGPAVVGWRGAFAPDGASALIPVSRVPPDDRPTEPALWLIDVAVGTIVVQGPPQPCIGSVAIAIDGATAATAGCNGDLSLWDLAGLSADGVWTGPYAGTATDPVPVVGATFVPNDQVVIATRADGRIEAFSTGPEFTSRWSFDLGEFAGVPTIAGGEVLVGVVDTVAGVGPSTGGMIGMPLDLGELVGFARSSVTRGLTDDECRRYLGAVSCSAR